MTNSIQNTDLYKSLFRGRTDIYAVRWEKDERGGYMPAYKVDWTNYNKHKAQGGTFKDYKNKEYLPLDDSALELHFSGKKTCGIYPLLEENKSITNKIYQEICEDSKATATRDLTELIEKFKILERSGEVGAGTSYKLIGS